MNVPEYPETNGPKPQTERTRTAREHPQHEVYIGLGSNINPEKNLARGLDLLRQYVRLGKLSSVWETPPIGMGGPNFLNAAVQAWTPLPPALFKTLILRRIEVMLGRVRTTNKYSPRPIDLDILVYDGQLMDPKVWTDSLVAVPLSEILPDYTNKETNERLLEAANRLAEHTPVKKREDANHWQK